MNTFSPKTFFMWKMLKLNLIFKIAMPFHRFEPMLGSKSCVNQIRNNRDHTRVSWLYTQSSIFHDGYIQMMQDTQKHAFTSCCRRGIIINFYIKQ